MTRYETWLSYKSCTLSYFWTKLNTSARIIPSKENYKNQNKSKQNSFSPLEAQPIFNLMPSSASHRLSTLGLKNSCGGWMLKEKKKMKTVWHPRQGMFGKLTWNGLFKMYSQGLFTIRSSAELHLRIPDQGWQDCVPGGETSTFKPFPPSFQLPHHLGELCKYFPFVLFMRSFRWLFSDFWSHHPDKALQLKCLCDYYTIVVWVYWMLQVKFCPRS